MPFVSMKLNGFGRTEFFNGGQFVGSIGASPFANMTEIRNAAGELIGQDRIDGYGNTQHLDGNMTPTGFSRPNPFGGFDSYNYDGSSSHATDTAFGINMHNSDGSTDCFMGDIDAHDDTVKSFMNHFAG